MSKKQEKALPLWDRRPWPSVGDTSAQELFAAIGAALTEWEYHETELAKLFSILVSGKRSPIARRAFSAVRTFEGRAEMLQAASEAYFTERPDTSAQDQFKELIRRAKCLAARRNEIAHGIVAGFWTGPDRRSFARVKGTYGLYPSFASYKNRRLDQAPDYCYSSKEVSYFRETFAGLVTRAENLSAHLLRGQQARPRSPA
jgi:hypothetical protein